MNYTPIQIKRDQPPALKRGTMTSEEAAAYIGICCKTLYGHVRTETIPYLRIGSKLVFLKDELDRWLHQRTQNKVGLANTDAASGAGAETA